MTRKLLASSALAALMAAGTIGYAGAQTDTQQPAQTEQQPAAQQPMPADSDPAAKPAEASAAAGVTGETNPTLTPDQPTLASAFMGQAVYSSQDPEADRIGEVNDMIVSDDGTITHAIVGVGGFLGIGEKKVSVPFEELEVVERDGEIRLIYAATREQLEAAEKFDRTAYDPKARAQPAPTGDIAAAPVNGNVPMASDPANNVAVAPAPDASQPAQTAANNAAPAPESRTTDLPRSNAEFMNIGEGQIRASTMLGKEVYGQDGDSIGEVADLVLQDDGKTRAAIVDVGGFLGVGEKRVAVPFNEIQTTKDGDEIRLTVAMTKEQLEQAPEFQSREMARIDQPVNPDPAAPAAGQAPATDMAAAPAGTQDPNAPAQVQTPTVSGEIQGDMRYELASQELTADKLIGTAVYSPNDENLGEVGDVVFDQAGTIQAVVIDVGGFLGMGQKPVAVQYDALNVQKNGNGDLRIVVNATQEQLEGAPAFDDNAAK